MSNLKSRCCVLEGDGEEFEGENDEYANVEFAEEEYDERVNFVLYRVLLTSKDEGQRKNLFKTHCFKTGT